MENGYQEIFGLFGDALAYPAIGQPGILQRLMTLLEAMSPESAQSLASFVEIVGASSSATLEEHYTRAFDLAPQAVPYLSVYLFGAESPQRGQFMAGLKGRYLDENFDCGGELPDHLATVLQFARVAGDADWAEIQQYCLPAPVRRMRLSLHEAGNPYEHLLASLESFLEHVTVGEPSHA